MDSRYSIVLKGPTGTSSKLCEVCGDVPATPSHYTTTHFFDEVSEELDDYFPNNYEDCYKCYSSENCNSLHDAVLHIGIAHRRYEAYLQKFKQKRGQKQMMTMSQPRSMIETPPTTSSSDEDLGLEEVEESVEVTELGMISSE